MNKSTTALCQPEQKLNSEPTAKVRNVSRGGNKYFYWQ